ncbi:MAG: hypothetical protein PHY45_11810 [Rhodocyclaceae bacterium]|nr:hypothetical protein [Rhodocyclaceae bacterium]
MPGNEIHVTALEHRLSAMRLFLGMLLGHLEDNGLIDRGTLEAEFWNVMEREPGHQRAREDLLYVFEMATILCDGWNAQRQAPRGDQGGQDR